MNKKWLAFLLSVSLVCLSTAASAELIAVQVSAPESFQAQYDSNTKKSTVIVDAQVFVPEVEAIPLFAVSARDFTTEEAWTLAKTVSPESCWQREAEEEGVDDNELVRSNWIDNAGYSDKINLYSSVLPKDDEHATGYVYLYNSYYKTVFGYQCDERKIVYNGSDGYNSPYFNYNSSSIEHDSAWKDISGQSTTMAEAEAIATEAAHRIDPAFELRFAGAVKGEICYHKESTSEYRNAVYPTPAYLLCFTRNVSDVPVTFINGSLRSEWLNDMPMAAAPGYESLIFILHNGQVKYAKWDAPFTFDEKLTDSASLMPFAQIMDIFGTIAPLSIQSMENESSVMGGTGNRLEITEIRLGYMPVLKKDDPNQWVLRPVWDFIGTRSFAREHYDWLCQSYLTIDAVDGTVIDRSYGY